MGEVLAQTLETVESQRIHYENKLMELEDRLNDARSKAVESEFNSNEKAGFIRQLETEKQVRCWFYKHVMLIIFIEYGLLECASTLQF